MMVRCGVKRALVQYRERLATCQYWRGRISGNGQIATAPRTDNC
jgi:hypothetical protein